MRPPWFEAGPALAAAGHTPFPLTAGRTGNIWTRPMVDTATYAFLPRIDAVTKPIVCADLMALARHIERKRDGHGLQLEDVEDLEFAGQPGLHRGVKVTRLDLANEPEVCLGFAWLRGSGREVLEPALRAVLREAGQRSAA